MNMSSKIAIEFSSLDADEAITAMDEIVESLAEDDLLDDCLFNMSDQSFRLLSEAIGRVGRGGV